jgi:hypothetical protein
MEQKLSESLIFVPFLLSSLTSPDASNEMGYSVLNTLLVSLEFPFWGAGV